MFSLNTVLFVCAIFAVLYAPRAFAWFASLFPQKRLYNDKKNKLALFIPARNEGKNIIPLLESIKAQTYDADCFDTFIAVKDPEDPVYEYAKIVNAEVYCDVTQTCKGDCTDYTFKKILEKYPEKYDGFIIVDADCLLEKTFLEEMNNAMASGADVINAKKRVRNYYQDGRKNSNLVTACNGLIWTFMDDMGNRFRSDHNLTTMTVTTGILFTRKVVEEMNGWCYRKTLTEDMEFCHDSILKNRKCFYYSYAMIYMEEAPSLAETNKRRSRWMHGLTHSNYIYFADLIKNRQNKPVVNFYFMFSLWLVYLFVATLIGMAAINLVCSALAIGFGEPVNWEYVISAGAAVFAIYAAFFILTAVALFINRKDIKLTKLGFLAVLFVHPVFYMGYIPIVAKAIVSKNDKQWDAIARVQTDSSEVFSE